MQSKTIDPAEAIKKSEQAIQAENLTEAIATLENFLAEKDHPAVWRKLAYVKIMAGKDLEARAILKFLIPKLQNLTEWELAHAKMPLTRCVIDQKHKILYTHIPKCGSSSIKDLIHFIRSGDESKETSHFKVTDMYKIVNRSEFQKKYHDWERILIVRDPINRLRSYYQTNINAKNSLARPDSANATFFGLNTNPTYTEILENFLLYRQYFVDFRHHTNSIVSLAGKNPNNYTTVKDVTEINAVLKLVAELGNSDRCNFENMKSQNKVNITEKELELENNIRSFYKSDYDAYGNFFINR